MTNSDINNSFYLLQARPCAKHFYIHDLIDTTMTILILHK